MDAVIQDESVFGGSGQVAKAHAQVQAERAAIGQEAGSAEAQFQKDWYSQTPRPQSSEPRLSFGFSSSCRSP